MGHGREAKLPKGTALARKVAIERMRLAHARGQLDEAVAQGIFGAPIFVLDGERFWGQDRLDFLDRALHAKRLREAS